MADVATLLADAESKMNKAVEVAKDDFGAIRTGRAHPAMFNKIMVDYYVVRPNQGILKPQQDTTTKVIFNFPLDSRVSDIWLLKPLTHSHLREYFDRKRNNR